MANDVKRLNDALNRDLFILEDESNPSTSKLYQIYSSTTLDQVFDDQSPTNKSLRVILDDLRQEILTGGRGNIVFPVTSVNGKTDDVMLTKYDVGLGRADNTADIDKPLSTPQRDAIMSILDNYNFHVNLQDIYAHIMDTSTNPHKVTFDQLNENNTFTDYIDRKINSHNISTNYLTHTDIRRNLMRLWNRVDEMDADIEDRLNRVLDGMDNHYNDEYAHQELFDQKENLVNKVKAFTDTMSINHTNYPSTRAVAEYVINKITEFNDTLPNIEDWIVDIKVVDRRSDLPTATSKYVGKVYFIRYGNTSYNEIAIGRVMGTKYYWDISDIGTYSKFNSKDFVDSPDGLSINMGSVIDAILDENGALDTSLSNVLKAYYNKNDIDAFHYISDLKVLPGTKNGTIRFYINDDMTTMSEDVQVAGLKRLAYLNYVTEDEIWDNAIYPRHIVSNAIETRHIIDKNVLPRKIQCNYGAVIGNNRYPNDAYAHEIQLTELADMLVPLIAGLPDPSIPLNPYFIAMNEMTTHPHKYTPGQKYSMRDHSYITRFTGTISVDANRQHKVVLTKDITSKGFKIIDAGGSWQYQSTPEEWAILGGSNITGHTFATIILTEDDLKFESISIGDRMNATYDIWIRYIDLNETKDYEMM